VIIMKKVLMSLAAVAVLFSNQSFAQQRKVAEAKSTATTQTRAASDDTSGNSSFWFGLSTDTVPTLGNGVGSLTAMLSLSEKLALQMYFSMPSTSPFIFGVGAALKATVVGNSAKGFHVGGGFGLGNPASTFGARIYGLLGIHYTVVDGVMLAADGSAMVNIAGGGTQFGIGPNSALLGASLLFQL
jgi:hypothetical protein